MYVHFGLKHIWVSQLKPSLLQRMNRFVVCSAANRLDAAGLIKFIIFNRLILLQTENLTKLFLT